MFWVRTGNHQCSPGSRHGARQAYCVPQRRVIDPRPACSMWWIVRFLSRLCKILYSRNKTFRYWCHAVRAYKCFEVLELGTVSGITCVAYKGGSSTCRLSSVHRKKPCRLKIQSRGRQIRPQIPADPEGAHLAGTCLRVLGSQDQMMINNDHHLFVCDINAP